MNKSKAKRFFVMLVTLYTFCIGYFVVNPESYQFDAAHPLIEAYGVLSALLTLFGLYIYAYDKKTLSSRTILVITINTFLSAILNLVISFYEWEYRSSGYYIFVVFLYMIFYPPIFSMLNKLRKSRLNVI